MSNVKPVPFRVSLLLSLLMLFTAWNVLRAQNALARGALFLQYGGLRAFLPAALGGIFWALAGIFLLWSVFKWKRWAGKACRLAAAAYLAFYWAERLLLQAPRPNWMFAVIVQVTLFVFILFATKSLLREAYEREPQNPKVE